MNRFKGRTTALLVSALVLAPTVGITATPAQAEVGRGNPTRIGPPRGNGNGTGSTSGVCAGVPTTQTCFGGADSTATDVAKMLGQLALKQGAGFIFKQIGLDDWLSPDPTQGKLDALKVQIAQVSAQLVTLQASVDQISRDLQQLNLSQAYYNIKAPIDNTQYVFKYAFLPVFNAAVDAQNATPATRDAKLAILADKKDDFLKAFNSYQLGSASTQIHDALMPNGVSTSIVDAYGRVLMANNRFVTAKDSKTLADLYTVFREQEALAVWMKAEYTAAKNPDLLGELIDTEVTAWQQEEELSLPPQIPDDAAIDLGPTAATRTRTSRRPMWLPQREAWKKGAFPTFNWRVGDSTSPNGVEQALVRLNTTAPGGFDDWQAPTRAEVTTLLSDFVKGHAPRLAVANPAWQSWEQFQTFVWVSDQVDQKVECGQKTSHYSEVPVTDVFTRSYPTHVGLWLNNAQPTNYNEMVWAPFPKLAARVPSWSSNISPVDAYNNCDAYAQVELGGGQGGLLATRDTGSVEYLAQRRPNGASDSGPSHGSHGHGHGNGHGLAHGVSLEHRP